jgi:phosphoserine phosphatase
MSEILTLIAADRLDDSMLSRLSQSLAESGASLQPPDWLAAGRAVDIPFTRIEAKRAAAITAELCANAPVDFLVHPAAGRRKKLLIADMDSTMVVGETLDELAAHAGLKDHVAEITRRSMNGELDFKTALRERVGLLRGLAEQALAETDARVELMAGARTLVATMRRFGALTVLVSGGFDYFTSRVRLRCGFDDDRANHLEITDGRLTGRVREPILDRDAKLAFLHHFAGQHGVEIEDAMAVGDGANDLAMIRAAGLGVAFHAKPVVAGEARFRVEHNDLTALLFAQGYRESDLVR